MLHVVASEISRCNDSIRRGKQGQLIIHLDFFANANDRQILQSFTFIGNYVSLLPIAPHLLIF